MEATHLDEQAGLLSLLQSMRERPPIEPRPFRDRPCNDCAVVFGFYSEYSEALKLASRDEQLALSKQWFCHETPGFACRGNANNLELL